MNCRKCGSLLNVGDAYCKVCGEAVVQGNAEVQNGQQVVQPTQPAQSPQPSQIVGQQVQQLNNQGGVQQQAYQPTQQINQGMPNTNMGQVMMTQPKKNNSSFMIVVIILVLIIIGLGGFIGYKVLLEDNVKTEEKKEKDTEENSKAEKDDNEKNDNEQDANSQEDSDGENVVADNTNIYEYGGYKFVIPEELKYEIDNGLLTFTDSVSFQSNFGLGYYPYDSIVAGTLDVESELISSGATIVAKAERQFEDRRFYLFQLYRNNKNYIFYFTKIDDYYSTFGLVYANSTNGYETALKYVDKLMDNMSKTATFAPDDSDKKEKLDIDFDAFENTDIKNAEYSLK